MPVAPPPHRSLVAPPPKDERPSAARRGYGRRWRRMREVQLRREPLCRACAARGIVAAATDVDHIVPRRLGGANGRGNLQSLCHGCHSGKTRAEAGEGRGLALNEDRRGG